MNKYRFQLVLQFPTKSIEDFDQLIAFETILRNQLRPMAYVDGHDYGKGEFNLFILTESPRETFGAAESIRQQRMPDRKPVAAYREVYGEDYTVLSPVGYGEFTIS